MRLTAPAFTPALALTLPLVLAGCTKLGAPTCTPVGAFPGPEDFDRVEIDGQAVLLVSAAERREGRSEGDNGIWRLDWPGTDARKLELHGRDDCSFAPHGMATAQVEPGRWELWVVNHHTEADRERCEGLRHSIEHFRVEADGLHFLERLTGPELTNPNEIDALPDGRLWLSNNPAWEGGKGLLGDMLFHRAKGQILHYDPASASFSVVADDLLYANGVAVVDGRLWVSSAYGKLFHYELGEDGSTRSRVEHRTDPRAALDNIVEAEGALWMTGHPKSVAFLRHAKDPNKNAPTVAYRIDPSSTEVTAVAYWREGEVNAGSTIWPIDDQFVLAQVFDAGLRVCGPRNAE